MYKQCTGPQRNNFYIQVYNLYFSKQSFITSQIIALMVLEPISIDIIYCLNTKKYFVLLYMI